jgi:hypothetical protein
MENARSSGISFLTFLVSGRAGEKYSISSISGLQFATFLVGVKTGAFCSASRNHFG